MRKGRFSQPVSDVARKFSESVSSDRRLYRWDIEGSLAHAEGLAGAGILSAEEANQIREGLNQIAQDIDAGTFEWKDELEDVHMNIEAALTARIGAAGAKLHTARSRNDQIALDLRLYVKNEIGNVTGLIRDLQRALIELADANRDIVMPGYTHLQRAQPIFLSHYLLAHVEAFARDIARLDDCLTRTDVLPLGAGALAGSTIVLDRKVIAERLGFAAISQNSVDAVGDRDFVAEFLFCLAMIGMHLSRLSEELVLWSTSEFNFIEFGDAFATGSSLMPQKKNPDMAELARGKTGRLYGNLISILTTLKGLPSSYNRDLQEDKEALFDSVDTIRAALDVFAALLPEIRVNRDRMEKAANDPGLLATDLAEFLVMKGVPFRDAYDVVGKLVARAGQIGLPLDQVPATDRKALSPFLADIPREMFTARTSLAKRKGIGAPSPENVADRIKYWQQKFSD